MTAGFLFDVPVRFDTDYLEVDLVGLRGRRDPEDSADRDQAVASYHHLSVIPGRAEGASPESSLPCARPWIPGSALRAAPE